MVLEVCADAPESVHRINSNLRELVGIADAGQLQDLRRLHGPGAEENLAVGERALGLALAHVVDPHRPAAFDHDPGDACARQGSEIGPGERRVQIAGRGAAAAAVA